MNQLLKWALMRCIDLQAQGRSSTFVAQGKEGKSKGRVHVVDDATIRDGD